MEEYKGRVFIGYDTEFVSNSTKVIPFAVGLAVLAFDPVSNRFEVQKDLSRRILIDTGPLPDVELTSLQWWLTEEREMFERLRDPTKTVIPVVAATEIVEYLRLLKTRFGDKTLVFLSDDESDQEKMDVLLETVGYKWMRYYNSERKHAASLSFDGFRKAWELLRPTDAPLEPTEHQHTHDPLDDSLEMLERFQIMLNRLLLTPT